MKFDFIAHIQFFSVIIQSLVLISINLNVHVLMEWTVRLT